MNFVASTFLILTLALFSSSQAQAQERVLPKAQDSVCQIDGRTIGFNITQREVNSLSVIGKNLQESLPWHYEAQPISPIPYDWINPTFRELLRTENEYESMQAEALQALLNMLDEAQKEGMELFIHSAYRPYQIQCSVFIRKVRIEMKDKGLNLEQAIAAVNTRSAFPGQSEHQLGTAVDLVTNIPGLGYKLEYEMERTPAFLWLEKNAAKYGFVLSFPKARGTALDQPHPQTGYIYEPWHWRYIHPFYAERFKECRGMVTPQAFLRALSQNANYRCR